MDWQDTFDAIALCIESKDYDEARCLIDSAIAHAQKVLINPEILVSQLEQQKNSIS